MIRELDATEAGARLAELGAILVNAVAQGASVNFLRGFSQPEAEAWWQRQVPGIAAGTTRLFVAEAAGRVIGTVLLFYAPQPNQPHRGEIGKMLVHSAHRRRGIGQKLLAAAETAARAAGKTLLVLDTEAGSAGDALYRRCCWIELGTVPGYALTPDGVPAAATFFWKRIA
jgi:GNAT superfamily N-acetyltransferase